MWPIKGYHKKCHTLTKDTGRSAQTHCGCKDKKIQKISKETLPLHQTLIFVSVGP